MRGSCGFGKSVVGEGLVLARVLSFVDDKLHLSPASGELYHSACILVDDDTKESTPVSFVVLMPEAFAESDGVGLRESVTSTDMLRMETSSFERKVSEEQLFYQAKRIWLDVGDKNTELLHFIVDRAVLELDADAHESGYFKRNSAIPRAHEVTGAQKGALAADIATLQSPDFARRMRSYYVGTRLHDFFSCLFAPGNPEPKSKDDFMNRILHLTDIKLSRLPCTWLAGSPYYQYGMTSTSPVKKSDGSKLPEDHKHFFGVGTAHLGGAIDDQTGKIAVPGNAK
ncbi:hypothetical protein GNI_184960 [Gregarina niphandrodes]|uniref:Uncharacterized protein n=1 Tax=Gregarina niphandrodes TaxID=110365 RepID=A0A023AX29_GRENI|nr:hypothetical protein GNI_184960 [Gregarina niphandrodes]EZG43147.1 hypothetical protein GNI_184960 [Gregarina niphandrodes]|eukprot:XP_011133596.1 hypothetical protein GNI_184960 [Gregarina niphandrodes]